VKSFLFILVIIWFVLGASAAHDRGYFNTDAERDCDFVGRSEEHTSELQSHKLISYAVFCLKKKKKKNTVIYLQQI